MLIYKAIIAYDGSAFYGFAPQKHYPTVYEVISKALSSVGINTRILAASRTDKGVHSTRQVISFTSHKHWDLAMLRNLLNLKLTPHIVIRRLSIAPSDFHPRFCATWRAYRFLLTDKMPHPFCSRYVTFVKIGDRILFYEALKAFEGRHNFMMFKKNGTYSPHCEREIFCIHLFRYRGLNVVYVRANSFLRAQVRLMVGSALSVSKKEISLESLKQQIAGEKQVYSYPISPNGLYLCGVGYT